MYRPAVSIVDVDFIFFDKLRALSEVFAQTRLFILAARSAEFVV